MMEFDFEVPARKAPIAQLQPVLELLRVTLRNTITHVFNKDGSVNVVEVPEGAANNLPDLFKNILCPKKLTPSSNRNMSPCLPRTFQMVTTGFGIKHCASKEAR